MEEPSSSELSSLSPDDRHLISCLVSTDLQRQLERVSQENIVLQNEIAQLRSERDFLFSKLLGSPAPARLSISAPVSHATSAIPLPRADAATFARPCTCEFSKEKLMTCLSGHSNAAFAGMRDFLKESKSGDAMVSFLVNSTGNAISDLEREVHDLRVALIREQNKRRKERRQALESLTESMSQKLQLRCDLIDEKHRNSSTD